MAGNDTTIILPGPLVTALWREYGPRRFTDPLIFPVPSTQAIKVSSTQAKRVGIIITVPAGGDVYYGWQQGIGNDTAVQPPWGHRLPAGTVLTLATLAADERVLWLIAQSGTGPLQVSVSELQLVNLAPS